MRLLGSHRDSRGPDLGPDLSAHVRNRRHSLQQEQVREVKLLTDVHYVGGRVYSRYEVAPAEGGRTYC